MRRRPGEPVLARGILIGAALLYAAYLAHLAVGFGGTSVNRLLDDFAYDASLAASAAVCLHRGLRGPGGRAVWLLLGGGLAAWALGDLWYSIFYTYAEVVPIPSPADVGYLAMYPFAYAAVALLFRAGAGRVKVTLWLDGAVAGMAVGAVAAALVFNAVQQTLGGEPLVNMTNLAYPLGDALLLALMVAGLALTGWRPGRVWLLLSCGLLVFAVADSVYLYTIAKGTYSAGLLDVGWPIAMLVIAYAAWTPPSPAGRVELAGWRVLAVPAAFGLLALGVLVYDHFERVSLLAVILAAASLVAMVARTVLLFAENLRILERTREESLTDSLTGLGNRRRLELEREAKLASGEGHLLISFDLNGFKPYNDTFGHPAGDALLAGLGRRLAASVHPAGTAFRLGGDEFCVIVPHGGRRLETWCKQTAAALSAAGEAFSVTASWGAVVVPAEAADKEQVLRIADRRMYEQKHSGRPSAGRQSTNVLLRVLEERQPELGRHLHSVATLAQEVGRRLGLEDEELEHTAFAAELHDVGKVAIPDTILLKPAALDDAEWNFMRRHTLIGERIVQAAPALGRVARLVRASHERWDGDGYPDELAGEGIPLGARIVSACDAFEAMISERPYGRARPHAEAVGELRRCAGTQFDPAVVRALLAVLAEREAAAVTALAEVVPA